MSTSTSTPTITHPLDGSASAEAHGDAESSRHQIRGQDQGQQAAYTHTPPWITRTDDATPSPLVPSTAQQPDAAPPRIAQQPAPAPVTATPTPGVPPAPATTTGIAPLPVAVPDEALLVRHNLLQTIWTTYRSLGRPRRWILLLRLMISLIQVIPAIVILSLPTSLGNSPGKHYNLDTGEGPECDPEPIFVFLALHTVRVAATMPLDFYLGLSPHRSARQRRPGAPGQAERERSRRMGSLELDRKTSRLADLLGFLHIVVFAVGNYAVWTRTECNARPADSVPLWWTSLAVLILTYVVLFNVVLLTFLVVFFLPATLAVLRALGLGGRIAQQGGIRPETGKIKREEVDGVTKLVYYVAEGAKEGEASRHESSEGEGVGMHALTLEAASVPLPPSRAASTIATDATTTTTTGTATPMSTSRWSSLLRLLLRKPRERGRRKSPQLSTPGTASSSSAVTPSTNPSSPPPAARALKYPLHPLPPHRATCPICLVDFETPDLHVTPTRGASAKGQEEEEQSEEGEPEPLRLLPCGHVLHRSCVDEWLTSVSGRCPVCQRPLLADEAGGAGPGEGQGQGQGDLEARRPGARGVEGREGGEAA